MREAGGRVRENFMLRDAGIAGVAGNDQRAIEVVVTGLTYKQGVPLAIDCTLVSPIKCNGQPHPQTAHRPGASLAFAARRKHRTYKELSDSSVLRLVVAAVETGGRLHRDARAFEGCCIPSGTERSGDATRC